MEYINTHTHTELSGHGEGTVEEVGAAAFEAGLTTLALTEHYPLSSTFDPQRYLSMPADKKEEYKASVRALREVYPSLEILLGCEFDWLGDREDREKVRNDLAQFDVILGSVHFIDGWAFDDPAFRGQWEEAGPDYIWKRYFEVWCEAVSSDMPFTLMSHPDLCKKFAYYPSFDVAPLYREAAEVLRESGRMVEVNTSGLLHACHEMYPAPALLKEFCRAGVACTVGTDAHQPCRVADGLSDAYKLMYESGYREVTVPTREGGRRCITIE